MFGKLPISWFDSRKLFKMSNFCIVQTYSDRLKYSKSYSKSTSLSQKFWYFLVVRFVFVVIWIKYVYECSKTVPLEFSYSGSISTMKKKFERQSHELNVFLKFEFVKIQLSWIKYEKESWITVQTLIKQISCYRDHNLQIHTLIIAVCSYWSLHYR